MQLLFRNNSAVAVVFILPETLKENLLLQCKNYQLPNKIGLTLYGPNYFFRRFSGHNLR